MEFTETLTIEIPQLSQRQLAEFAEHGSAKERALVIEVAAIHEGMTANHNFYPATELAASLPSWTSPYPKPVLLHHDPFSEAVGRVIGSRMDKEDDGTPYIRLQVAITAAEAVQKVKDQRYLTGSVGGKAGKANCSICQADWSQASMFELPCKHRRGKSYNGKLAHIEMADITFKEYSFVNMPADQKSGVRAVHQTLESEEDFQSARFFCLDMAKEGIVELGESEHNVLEGLKPEYASSLYLGLKGAFLSALAEDARENKENGMGDTVAEAPPVVDEEEDILAVAESLSDDLSAPAAEDGDGEDEEAEEGADTPSNEQDEPGAGADEPAAPDGDAVPAAPDAPEQPAEPPAEEPPGTPAPDTGDATGDAGGESEVAGTATTASSENYNNGISVGTTPNFTVMSGNTTYTTTGTAVGSTGSYTISVLPDPKIAELEQQLAAVIGRGEQLAEENTRLKKALKKGLVERVVDLKIALGVGELEEREALLEEHMARSASSLADSLRDLASMPGVKPDYSQMPTIQPSALAVGGDDDRETVVGATSPKPQDPEDLFVDALMGRRPL